MRTLLFAVLLYGCCGAVARSQDAAAVPEHVIENTRYLVGQWTAEVELDGEQRRLEMTVKPMPGDVGYVVHWRGLGGPDEEDVELTAVGGWDAASGRYRESGFTTTGDYFSFSYKPLDLTQPAAMQKSEAEGVGVYMGKPMTEKVFVERQGPDKFIWKATDIQVGGEASPDEVYYFTRTKDASSDWLAFLVGDWTRETRVHTEADGWKVTTADWTGELIVDGKALLTHGRESNGVAWTCIDSRFGDAMIEQGSASDGGAWKITWNGIDTEQVRGSLDGFMPDGESAKGRIVIDREGDGYVARWSVNLSDGTTMKGVETNRRRTSAEGQADQAKSLDAWGKTFAGNWLVTTTLSEDRPGVGQQGDKLENQVEIKKFAEGVYHAVATAHINGQKGPTGTGVIGWNPANGQVELRWFNTTGASGMSTYAMDGSDWKIKTSVVRLGGIKESEEVKLVVADKDKLLLKATHRLRGDEKLPDAEAVWTRK